MPKNNSGSVSFPGGDGEPVIIAKEDFVSEQHLPLGEPAPEAADEGDEQTSAGFSSSPSSERKPSTNANNSKKTNSR